MPPLTVRFRRYKGHWAAIAGLLSLPALAGNDAGYQEPGASSYRSAFADYESFADTPLKPWRDANDEVAEQSVLGGHSMSTRPAAEDSASQSPRQRLPKNGDGHGALSQGESQPKNGGGHGQR